MTLLRASANVGKVGTGTVQTYEPRAAKYDVSVDQTQSVADNNTALSATDLVASTASTGVIAQYGSGAGSGPVTYSTSTHNYSGNTNTSTTISQANGNSLVALLNTVGADLVTVKADLAAMTIDNIGTAQADFNTALTDFDLVATTATNGVVAQLNTAGGGPLTYSTSTHQYSGNCGTSSTITQTVGNAMLTLLNTFGTALKQVQTDLAALPVSPDIQVIVNSVNVTSLSRLNNVIGTLLTLFQGPMNP